MTQLKYYFTAIAFFCFSFFTVAAQVKLNQSNNEIDNGNIHLSDAVLILPTGVSGPELKASEMLLDEVAKRSRIRWEVVNQLPGKNTKGIVLGQREELIRSFPSLAEKLRNPTNDKAEGYRIVTLEPNLIIVCGNDSWGVLYGAGKLLRMMDYARDTVSITGPIDLSTSPRYALRGHQLGYRPKTNSYDGWSVPMWEQYIRDLVVFGANAIELIPPVSDDDSDSPHFPLSQMKMMIEMSRLAKEYGIECWVWYPAMEKDYGNKATVEKALKDWGNVLSQLPRVDAVFVPGGDPGHTAPKDFFPMLEKQTRQLKKLHPGATMWMSPQGFTSAWMSQFYSIIKTEPDWLEG
ncbi:MAG: hypothetical protein ABI288_08735, partial [Ginsengibacter sp.]